MSCYEDPLHVAKRLGLSIAGELGDKAFQEMELAYINSLLPRFSDNPIIRMRQNLLLYWDQSYLKTTLVDEFCKCLSPTLPVIDITSNSPETLFGTINENDRIVYPLFTDVQIAKVTELATFVGRGRDSRDIVNTMNKIMEGECVTRQLLKFGRRELPRDEIKKAEARGVYYNPVRAQLSYKPQVSIFAASRPLDNRTYTYLRGSGHFYRYHVLQREITDEEAKTYFVENYRPNATLYGQLTRLNERLASVSVKRIKMPGENITKDLFDHLRNAVEEEIEDRKVRLATIIDLRTKGDILRELAACAAMRAISENNFCDVEDVEYDAKDIKFVKSDIEHFVEFKIRPLFVEEWSKSVSSRRRLRRDVKELIAEFLSDGSEKSRRSIVGHILSKIKVSLATIDSTLREMVNKGVITSPRHGLYKVSEKRRWSIAWKNRDTYRQR